MEFKQRKVKIIFESETKCFEDSINEAILEINGGTKVFDVIIDIKFSTMGSSQVAMIIYWSQ